MADVPDNRYWELRRNVGQPKSFATPDDLWKAACQYFDWCDENPWYKVEQLKKPFAYEDPETGKMVSVTTIELPTARPYTIEGLCLHMGVSVQTFLNYGQKETYKEYFEIVTHIRNVIYNQKFEGAAVGAFNPSIMARDLGLADKKEHGGEVSIKQITGMRIE